MHKNYKSPPTHKRTHKIKGTLHEKKIRKHTKDTYPRTNTFQMCLYSKPIKYNMDSKNKYKKSTTN